MTAAKRQTMTAAKHHTQRAHRSGFTCTRQSHPPMMRPNLWDCAIPWHSWEQALRSVMVPHGILSCTNGTGAQVTHRAPLLCVGVVAGGVLLGQEYHHVGIAAVLVWQHDLWGRRLQLGSQEACASSVSRESDRFTSFHYIDNIHDDLAVRSGTRFSCNDMHGPVHFS